MTMQKKNLNQATPIINQGVKQRKTGTQANVRGKMWISIEDRNLVRKRGMGLQDYWLDCWQADPFGNNGL